jgi:hypothetical protein
VTVSLDDGSSIDVPTVEAVRGVPLRAFAASVPVGATVTDVEERPPMYRCLRSWLPPRNA